MLLNRLAATPDREAFTYPVGATWQTATWRQFGDRVRAISGGLRALGLKPEEPCSILSSTRYDWVVADLGIMCAGGATTTIYPSTTPDDCAYILSDSGTGFVFAETDEHVQKLLSRRKDIPTVRKVITFDGKAGHDGWVMTLDELIALGKKADAEDAGAFERIARAVKNEQLATLIYTSGTTGRPKGVELTHDCWAYEGEAIESLGILTSNDVQYFWLPLAHSFGKVLEAAQLRVGFRTAIDGRVDKIVENLAIIKPTFVAAVPRIFEKVYNRVIGNAQTAGGAKWAIFQWAIATGRKVSAASQAGRPIGALLALQNALADRLVFSKLKARFGGNLRFFISGSAPLARELSEFFHAAGILLLEGYGLTESSAATFVNLPHRYRFGTVGLPLPGTEVRIAPEDGEVLLRGRGIMRGYHNLPNDTREALDADGWLHTGDIGELKDGFLRLTDRKKDLIKTSGGKYIAPQALENRLKLLFGAIGYVVVHGNNRNFCTALVTLDEESIKAWAKEQNLGALSYAELTTHEKVRAAVQAAVDQLNAQLASFETIKKFAILPKDLNLESGEITPSLKVKRKTVEQRYKHILDGFYAGANEAA